MNSVPQESSNEQKKSEIEAMIVKNRGAVEEWEAELGKAEKREANSPYATRLPGLIKSLNEYIAELEKELAKLG